MVDLIVDGSTDFLAGQNSALNPDKIAANSYAAGINVSVSKGVLRPRWGYEKFSITWPEGYVLNAFNRRQTYKTFFETGKFQAMAPYLVGDRNYLIFIVSGFIFALDLVDTTILPISVDDGSHLNSRASRINWSASGRYLEFYDFPAYPIILEGLHARRASPVNMEIPAATIGTYNQNRLFVSNSGTEFTGGDPVGSLAAPNAPITFMEVMTPGSPYYGQIFQLPTSDHNDAITFMGFLQVTDTSTGVGPLLVATERAIYSYGAQNPRSAWEGGQFGSMFCYNAGVVGPRAFANVNSDAFFIARDGHVRALSMSRDAQATWSKVPISLEVQNWFKYWDSDLIKFGFVGNFNNKIFFSVNPYRVAAIDYESGWPISDYAHGGLVVLELDRLTSFGSTVAPAWAGLWTGVHPMDMATTADRAFIMSKDGQVNTLYEINPNINYDKADEVIRPVRSKIYTKEYEFEDPFMNKELHSLDINCEALKGDISLIVRYKPSHSACYLPWIDFKHYAPWRCCEVPENAFLNGYATHQIRDMTFGAPDANDCDPIANDFYRVVRRLQLELTLIGIYWEIGEIRIKAIPQPQSGNITICESFPTVAIPKCCDDDWYTEPFGSCEKMVT